VIYFVLPDTVDEKFKAALYPPTTPALVMTELQKRDIDVVTFDTEDALKTAVEAGEYRVVSCFHKLHRNAVWQERQLKSQLLSAGIPTELNRASTTC
jgi:hypothetical protein